MAQEKKLVELVVRSSLNRSEGTEIGRAHV